MSHVLGFTTFPAFRFAMVFFTAGFGLLLHLLFWGAGLSLLFTPRRWTLGWPAMCAPVGLALQSAVVWFGARTGVAGTQVYATWCELIPVLFLAIGLASAISRRGRRVASELKSWRDIGILMVLVLNALLIPFAVASKSLTTSSLGSCDAADYAAGARVFLEFSRYDRSGFIGLTEVVRLHSVDNFFDHWVRLNHFTPSALIAFHSAVFSYRPYEIVSIMTAVFVALSLPTVCWLARSTFRFGPVASGWISAVYGFSPLLWYAVYNVAMSQILAAIAIALLNGVALAAWKERSARAGLLRWSGLLAVSYWLILGAYNFIVIVCLVPAVSYVAWEVLETRDWRKLRAWLCVVALPLVVVALVFTQRTLGLLERFTLFQEYDFGWKIPALTPEGWLGLVGSISLGALPSSLRWPFLALLIILSGVAYFLQPARDARRKRLLACASLPILAGYAFLCFRGVLRGTNASYDAYKLLCVFFPGILAASAYWLKLTRLRGDGMRIVAIAFSVIVIAFSLHTARQFIRRMESPPLLVDRSLLELQQLEGIPEVDSVNMLIEDFWSRLWANALLLHKAQYFPSYTYEGRRNTALKGNWDLHGGIIRFTASSFQPSEKCLHGPYSLVDTRGPGFLRATEGDGWYDTEVIARSGRCWRWTKGDASIALDNPGAGAKRMELRFAVRSLLPRDFQVWLNGARIQTFSVGADLRTLTLPAVAVQPGHSVLELRSSQPPISPGPADDRRLGFAVYAVEIQVLNETGPAARIARPL